jgi:hypothetical protein
MFDISDNSILQTLIFVLTEMDIVVKELINTFSENIATGSIWEISKVIIGITKTVALTLLTGYWLIGLINEITEIDWKHLSMWWYFKKFIQLLIGKALVEKSVDICLAIYNLVGWGLNEIGIKTSNFELFSTVNLGSLKKMVNDMGLMEKLVFKMDLIIPQIVILLVCGLIIVIAEIRVLSIYLLITISPICFATVVNKGASGVYPFIKEYVGITAQAIIMLIVTVLYNARVIGVMTGEITGFESLFKIAVHSVVLAILILSSQGVAKMFSGR